MFQNPTFLLKLGIDFLAASLSSYLLFEDFNLYLAKPTYSSKSVQKLNYEHFPNIFICPFPSYDMKLLLKNGYLNDYDYIKGEIMNKKLRGWLGNQNYTVKNIYNNISILKSTKDCPDLRAKLEDTENNVYDVHASYNITNPVYPNGRCCKASFPEAEENSRLLKIYFELKFENESSLEGFQMFLLSKTKSHYSKLDSFNTNGIYMKAWAKESNYQIYKIIINQENIEEDFNAHCQNYEGINNYEKVIIPLLIFVIVMPKSRKVEFSCNLLSRFRLQMLASPIAD